MDNVIVKVIIFYTCALNIVRFPGCILYQPIHRIAELNPGPYSFDKQTNIVTTWPFEAIWWAPLWADEDIMGLQLSFVFGCKLLLKLIRTIIARLLLELWSDYRGIIPEWLHLWVQWGRQAMYFLSFFLSILARILGWLALIEKSAQEDDINGAMGHIMTWDNNS